MGRGGKQERARTRRGPGRARQESKPYPNMTKSRPARSAATHSTERRRARVELVMPCRRLLPPPPKLTDRRW
jgi:hypothetical protein